MNIPEGINFRKLLFLVMIVMFLVSCAQFKTTMIQPFDNRGWGPGGMAWTGRDFLIGSRDLVFSLYNIETGSYLTEDSLFNSDGHSLFSRFPLPLPKEVMIRGMAWEGDCCEEGFLWIADGEYKELVKINLVENTLVKNIPAPGNSPDGIAFDGENLYVADSESSKIFKMSAEDGSVITEYKSPVEKPKGLTWAEGGLWIIGLNGCKEVPNSCKDTRLLKLKPDIGMVVQESDVPSAITAPASVEWINGVLWVSDINLNRIFKVFSIHDSSDTTVYTIPAESPHDEANATIAADQDDTHVLPPLQMIENPAAAPNKTYTVKEGDTLSGIVRNKLGGTPQDIPEILKANPEVKDPNRLNPGQVLNVPHGFTLKDDATNGGSKSETPGIAPVEDTTELPEK